VILIAGLVAVFWKAGAIKAGAATAPAEATSDCFMKERRLKEFWISL
jgi:hypothetical protein